MLFRSGKSKFMPNAIEYSQLHFTVLKHIDEITPYMVEHVAFLEVMHPIVVRLTKSTVISSTTGSRSGYVMLKHLILKLVF